MGGGKGGCDFDPKGKSDMEVMRFCQSFMTELYRHIGADTDVPAGDIGVGAREIGYHVRPVQAHHERVRGRAHRQGPRPTAARWRAPRPRATAWSTSPQEMLEAAMTTPSRARPSSISGSGNVAIYATREGHSSWAPRWSRCPTPPAGSTTRTASTCDLVKQIKEVERGRISEYANAQGRRGVPRGRAASGACPCDIALPCATQNELHHRRRQDSWWPTAARSWPRARTCPPRMEATDYFHGERRAVLPRQGGQRRRRGHLRRWRCRQNSERLSWTFEEVDAKLQGHHGEHLPQQPTTRPRNTATRATYVMGANIAGFKKVADAMMAQGIV